MVLHTSPFHPSIPVPPQRNRGLFKARTVVTSSRQRNSHRKIRISSTAISKRAPLLIRTKRMLTEESLQQMKITGLPALSNPSANLREREWSCRKNTRTYRVRESMRHNETVTKTTWWWWWCFEGEGEMEGEREGERHR